MKPRSAKPSIKKKIEFSRIFALAIAGLFAAYSIRAIERYYYLCELAISEESAVVPDASIATTCISMVIGALMSYLLYQAGLKNSRNKYGIDADGQPFKTKTEDPDETPSEENAEG